MRKKLYPSLRYKPVKRGGLFNHVEMFFLCLFSFPIMVFLAVVFGEQVDQFFSVWEVQFIFGMACLLVLSVLFAVRFYRNL